VFVQGVDPQSILNCDGGDQDIHPWEIQPFVPQFPGKGDRAIPILFRAPPVGKALEMPGKLSFLPFAGTTKDFEADRRAPKGFLISEQTVNRMLDLNPSIWTQSLDPRGRINKYHPAI